MSDNYIHGRSRKKKTARFHGKPGRSFLLLKSIIPNSSKLYARFFPQIAIFFAGGGLAE